MATSSGNPDANVRQPDEAIRLAERAAELTRYQHPNILDTLATAYAAAGRFDQAIELAQRALQLADTTRTEAWARQVHARLELFRQGKPYRQPVTSPEPDRP